MTKPCSFAPCDNPRRPKSSLCGSHKSQKERGKQLTIIPTKLTDTERFWSKVIKSDGCWNWISPVREDGYGTITIGGRVGKRWLAHRFSYEMAYGTISPGAEIDHRCLNRACVNPAHLREVSKKQNMENRAGLSANNTSGERGVTWYKALNKWRAQVVHNKANTHVGYFESLSEASAAVRKKRIELFTHNELDRNAA